MVTEGLELFGKAKKIFSSLAWARLKRTEEEEDNPPVRQGPEWRGFSDGFLGRPKRNLGNVQYDLHYDTWYVIGRRRREIFDNPEEDKSKCRRRRTRR